MQALRGDALEWWNTVTKQADINNVDDLKHYFLTDYATTANSRTTAAHIKIKQEKGQSVREYMSRLQSAFTNLELTVDPVPDPANVAECLPNPPAGVDVAGLPLAWLVEVVRAHRARGYRQFYEPTLRSLFIDGLLPHLKLEIIRVDPRTARAALEAAYKYEREYEGGITQIQAALHELTTETTPTDENVHYIQRGRGAQRGGRGGSYRGRGSNTNTSRSTVPRDAKCHFCQKLGHYQKECYTRLRTNQPMKPNPRQYVKEVQKEEEDEQEYISTGHLNW